MKKFLLPLALLALTLGACSDDDAPVDETDAGNDVGTLDVGISDTDNSDTVTCEPVCDGRECGADGCGGTCGTCADGASCSAGVCAEAAEVNCVGIIQCINGCTDQACATGCISQGTPEAQTQINAVFTCIQTNCSTVEQSELGACQQEFCADELNTCNGLPTSGGDATCGETFDCTLACTTEACATACLGEASTEGRVGLSALVSCGDPAGCLEGTSAAAIIECFETNCSTQYSECYAVPAVCGNGTVEGDETCDDGNTTDGDGCSSLCTTETTEAVCGDETVDEGEECDDGNTTDDDGCSSTCTIEDLCGNGTVDGDEACDDGNDVDDDECSNACTLPAFCGDGNEDEGEECDDGNDVDDDECANDCTIPLPPAPSCDTYCSVIEEACTGENSQYESTAACMTACGSMALGTSGDTAGDSVGCRTYHAGLASESAATHCPHAGEAGGGVCIDG